MFFFNFVFNDSELSQNLVLNWKTWPLLRLLVGVETPSKVTKAKNCTLVDCVDMSF